MKQSRLFSRIEGRMRSLLGTTAAGEMVDQVVEEAGWTGSEHPHDVQRDWLGGTGSVASVGDVSPDDDMFWEGLI